MGHGVRGQAGRLFELLAYTKTLAMFAPALLSFTLAPPLMLWLPRGRFRTEAENPVNRALGKAYRPIVHGVVRHSRLVVVAAVAVMVLTARRPSAPASRCFFRCRSS